MNARDIIVGMIIGAVLCAAYLYTRPDPPVDNGPVAQWERDMERAEERQRIILRAVDSLTSVIDLERAQRQRADSVAAAWERHFTRANYRDSSTVRKLEFITGHR